MSYPCFCRLSICFAVFTNCFENCINCCANVNSDLRNAPKPLRETCKFKEAELKMCKINYVFLKQKKNYVFFVVCQNKQMIDMVKA